MQLSKSNRAILFTLLVRIYPFSFLTMSNDTLEQEVPATPESETVEVPVDDESEVHPEGTNNTPISENKNISLTNGDMWFISDMLSGAKTPVALLNIGSFINTFVGLITSYQENLQKIEAEQNAEYMSLGKEFLVLDEQGRPTLTEDGKSYVLAEGKTDADFQDYNTRATNITTHFTQKKNDLANEVHIISVPHDVLSNFKYAFLYDISIETAQRVMKIKDENSGNFVAILYSITQKVNFL